MRKNKPSLKVNIIMSGIKACTTVIFPLITFKYAAAVLTVDNLGKVNYAFSVNGFFVLIAGLGISTYAVRELSPIRGNKEEIERIGSQIFSINIIATIVGYFVYFLTFILIPQLSEYWNLCAIFSVQLIFTALGTEWINIIYEDYIYITVRSVCIQVLCLILMFMFVHKTTDYPVYAVITMLSTVGPYLLNFFYCRKNHCKVYFTIHMDLKRHIKPVLFMFSTNVATTIFVHSDTVLLGYISGDYFTGLYGVATKIYLSAKQMLLMCITVIIPRIAYLIGSKEYKQVYTLYTIMQNGILAISLPVATGLIVLDSYIIRLISDSTYLPAKNAFNILSIALVICSLSYFYSNCVMIPFKMEKVLLLTTIAGAAINIVTNLFLIPVFHHTAAALTTFISELAVLILNIFITRRKRKAVIRFDIKNVIQLLIGCTGIVCVNLIVSGRFGFWLDIIISISMSILVYTTILLLMKNQNIMLIKNEIDKIIKKKRAKITQI